jgi:formylglycine-generating enzyme required for sulfatase activity
VLLKLVILASALIVASVLAIQRLPVPELAHQGKDRPFVDCEACPEMVTISAGTYHMGRQLRKREILKNWVGVAPLPALRTVEVERFALSRTEITFAQWEACVEEGECQHFLPADKRGALGSHPVTHVSWDDAEAYAGWLSRKTGHKYRLPSEAEWEYAARAGTWTPFSWGRAPDRSYANFGKEQCPPCSGETGGRDRWLHTAPVGQFLPNAFGLHDMHGNVYEWTQDCMSQLAPERTTASAVITEDCTQRVIRGGGWHSDARRIQSDYRGHNPPHHRDDKIGFRVARSM